jgi:hypothetical protein
MKQVMVRLKDLLTTVLSVYESLKIYLYKPNGFTVRLFNVYNVYKFSAINTNMFA